jgi:hypothetical protein
MILLVPAAFAQRHAVRQMFKRPADNILCPGSAQPLVKFI